MVTSLHRYQEAGLPLGMYIQILYGLECIKNRILFHPQCITHYELYYNFRYGGKRVFLTGIGATATLTLLTPVLTKTGTGFLVTTRILEGLFEVSH